MCEELKDELATCDKTNSLDSPIDLSIKIDNRLQERHREKDYKFHSAMRYSAPPTAHMRPALDSQAAHVALSDSAHSSTEPMQNC